MLRSNGRWLTRRHAWWVSAPHAGSPRSSSRRAAPRSTCARCRRPIRRFRGIRCSRCANVQATRPSPIDRKLGCYERLLASRHRPERVRLANPHVHPALRRDARRGRRGHSAPRPDDCRSRHGHGRARGALPEHGSSRTCRRHRRRPGDSRHGPSSAGKPRDLHGRIVPSHADTAVRRGRGLVLAASRSHAGGKGRPVFADPRSASARRRLPERRLPAREQRDSEASPVRRMARSPAADLHEVAVERDLHVMVSRGRVHPPRRGDRARAIRRISRGAPLAPRGVRGPGPCAFRTKISV